MDRRWLASRQRRDDGRRRDDRPLCPPSLEFLPADRVLVAGDDLQFFDPARTKDTLDPAQLRTAQAFGEKTVRLLSSLSIGVVGCSGTGSWIVEQLSRLGVGRLVMVDPDVTEDKNLNRIINSR